MLSHCFIGWPIDWYVNQTAIGQLHDGMTCSCNTTHRQ